MGFVEDYRLFRARGTVGLPVTPKTGQRALLLAILENANYNAYGHGARYLRKLDSLTEQIRDWKSAAEHRLFKEKIVAEHGRKSSFWAKYEGAK